MARSIGWAVLFAACYGCSSRPGGYERFIPSEDAARRYLVMALSACCDGRPTAPLETPGPPKIHLIDSQRKPGQRLKSFAVLGPTVGDSPRCYVVRLTLEQPSEEVRARYVIVGQDPIWVFRYEDYEMVVHWCAPMTSGTSATSRRGR